MELKQNNITRSEQYVSSKGTVRHLIDLKQTDANYIKSAPTVLSYWFVDCVYYGFNNYLQFDFNYTDPDKTHVVEALVVADFTPLPPTTTVPPSTTTKATTTTPKPTTTPQPTTTKTTPTTTSRPTTVTPSTTSVKPNVSTSVPSKHVVKREAVNSVAVKSNSTSKIMVKVNGSLVPYNGSFPYVCNSTQVTIDPKKAYGYFSEVIDVKGKFFYLSIYSFCFVCNNYFFMW